MDIRVKGDTRLFASIGDPVMHSISPQIHNSIFSTNGLNNIHIPMKIVKGELEEYIACIRNNFTGVSVTKPHKQDIIKYLDYIDDDADKFNAINVIKIENGLLKGFNTDGYGFTKSLELYDIDVKDKEILLLGSGGAARVIAFEILRLGGKLTIANRTIDNAVMLAGELSQYWDIDKINILPIKDLNCGYFGIINATPVGMYPDIEKSPIKKEILKGSSFVFDLIYNPEITLLLDYARDLDCKYINGFSMLFYQAIKAQEIWTDRITDEKDLLMIKKEIETYLKNGI